MSAAGKLTSGLVSAALLDQFIQLEYEAAKMGQTVSGAFNEGMVAYQLFVNEFNNQTGFTQSIVESIRSIVKSLEGFGKGFLASLKDGDSTLNSFLGLLHTNWLSIHRNYNMGSPNCEKVGTLNCQNVRFVGCLHSTK